MIVRSVQWAAQTRWNTSADRGKLMIPAKFDYKPAQSKALSLLAEYGDEAKLLAGGHSLLLS